MTRVLTPPLRLSRRVRVHLEFKPADAWIGLYWCNHGGFWDAWVCLLPCLPIHIYSIER